MSAGKQVFAILLEALALDEFTGSFVSERISDPAIEHGYLQYVTTSMQKEPIDRFLPFLLGVLGGPRYLSARKQVFAILLEALALDEFTGSFVSERINDPAIEPGCLQ